MLSEYRGKIPFYLKELESNIVYLCSSNKNIEDYYNTLDDFYDGEILKIESSSDRDEIEKINYDLLELFKSKKKYIILISLEGFLRDYYLEGEKIVFQKGRDISLKKIQEILIKNRYEKTYMIEKRMQYSLRGDILDIFPKNGDYPVRIEFFGDNVERITYFDIETQKSIESLDRIDMYMNNNKNSQIDFYKIINLSENRIIFENREILQYKLEEIILRDREREEKLRERFSQLDIIGEELTLKRFSEDEIKKFEDYENIKKLSKKEKILVISEESKRYQEIFKGYPIEFQHYPHYEGYRDENYLVLTDRELKGIKVKRETKEKIKLRYKDVSQIRENDYIIHENYGVGIYLGIETIDGQDYLKIKYADEDKLFVPVEGINKIERYISTDGVVPEIYQLGRRGFKRKREKLQEEMLIFAKEIIEIQARRAYEKGYKFSHDTVWQEEFEESFPYRETPSQLKAIEDVKHDMESDRVMDRVICGDVGYGKTEIAIRAAFKASVDGKQVALMVPTTVLAQQHFERFSERFKNYPITIELLSRLKTGKEQKEVLNRIEAGTIDIVIGTHRILSSDVKFKDLGLVIIDEEQKFGVKAKEQLKKIKNRIDMITLTATPIPRTLNLSLLGIRDLSVIDTPPEGRKPIETIFIEKDNKKLKDIIMEEIAREGQAFYIFNSVKNIAKKTDELRKILPNYLKLDFIHGQMTPKEIKNKIKEFENGDIDILVSTTIIENGIDIENANTMIIEGADRLGLSQIYQLRGRIGRGNRKGYCYLLTKEAQSKKSKEREESIRNLGDSGGGLQLSLEDMRIRGAGEILGEKQHGALETFGYNLYIKMLNEEIARLKGQKRVEDDIELEIKLSIDAFIPDYYIEKEEKLKIYRKAAELREKDQLDELIEEVRDRFGEMPKEVKNFFYYLNVKLKARYLGVEILREEKDGFFIKFNRECVNVEKITEMMSTGKLQYLPREEAIRYKGSIMGFFYEYEGVI